MLACHIVRDLLPSYLEHLTAPETDADIRAHLEGCPACRAAEAAMRADLPLERAPQPRLQFLKKLRWQQRLGAGLSALVTVLCLLGLYRMEYAYTLTGTAEMEAAVETYLADVAQLDARYQGTAVDVLETEPVGNQVLVLYRLENGGAFAAQGVARFERGILGGYRLRTVSRTDWPLVYSQVVKVQSRPYLVVTCANAPGGGGDLPGVRPVGCGSGGDRHAGRAAV